MIKNVYSVGQVNNYIKNMFSQDFLLKRISIKGEVSNCKYHTSGHIYFTIKDSSGTINAIMFAGNRRGLNFQMKEGDKVIVTGSVEIYERNGSYQIYAREIELDGEGNLYLKFEALKRELEEMGMFAPEYKQPIPRYAKRIGIVTAPTGAAVQDIRNISYRRNPYVQLILYPALVQGDGAAESIVNGIRALEHIGVDVIIVGRGGGSIEDLWAFNEEIVARAIFDCQIPIISAVGHETDWTIADYVADMRAPTPSAAAELAVYDYRLIVSAFAEAKRRMDNILIRRIELKREQLSHMKTRIEYLSPQRKLNDNRRRLVDYSDRIDELMQRIIIDKKNRLRLLAGTLDAYSPAKKLSQGYAFVEGIDGKAVKSINSTKPGDEIGIHFIDGSVKAVVSEVYSNE
ncbi:MAG: exodeoxyribonuclease VII large subunit [Agathobacter sp.]|nr:exodeoxyribonuclease VII large subunit [Agathobacter sp.]